MRDLEIRGAGNLLGQQQSGHIAAVGYEMYCRLLADAVRRARGMGPPPPTPAYLAIELPAGVPDEWVADAREKFRLLRRVASTETPEDFTALVTELRERFGAPPPAAERLLLAQRVRILAGRAGFVRITGAEVPGVVLTETPGAHGIERLSDRRIDVRRLSDETAFVALPGTAGPEATVRALVALLEPPPNP
jgi:transcription-repair coupling factor (superfamily II helicase)